ncbi:MAG: helix-turn-helix transcriptional regulator [Planctomycetes bacterium]|nr:helix-turn-helix transcriptional regulator [Planctomycetota bacterium]
MPNVHTPRYQRFLQKLREARQQAGLTQVQVAKALGKPQTFVSKCELGERRLDLVEVEDFAAVYGVTLASFSTLETRDAVKRRVRVGPASRSQV